jgi:hypothetical protein
VGSTGSGAPAITYLPGQTATASAGLAHGTFRYPLSDTFVLHLTETNQRKLKPKICAAEFALFSCLERMRHEPTYRDDAIATYGLHVGGSGNQIQGRIRTRNVISSVSISLDPI